MESSKSRSSSLRHSRRVGQGPSDCSGSSCTTLPNQFSTTSSIPPTEMSKEEWLKEIEKREFYKNYNAMDGAITAIVLGGFFAFVCLLVVYKTKCKPMWKNRRRKLTNTPATQSNAEVDICGSGVPNNGDHHNRTHDIEYNNEEEDEDDEDEDEGDKEQIQRTSIMNSPPILSVTPAAEDFGFECIPLQMGCFSSSEDYDGDLYYLDECGNYLFPIPSPNESGLCSCSQPPSSLPQNNNTLDSNLEPRRNSQVSSVSNAYTVKSLPGAYLYIPVVDPKSIPLGSVKRSLSDPEIHFASPNLGHPLILTVNPSSELTAKRGSLGAFPSSAVSLHARPALLKEKKGLQQRSFSIQAEPASINIQITTPTPTVSPAQSINSFNGNMVHPLPLEAVEESIGESDSNAAVVAATSDKMESSTSDVETENNESSKKSNNLKSVSEMSASGQIRGLNYRRSRVLSLQEPSSGLRQKRLRTMRQLTLPVNSSAAYLTVPPEGRVGMTSASSNNSVKRTNSFNSIVSEGDGDIFDSEGQLKCSSDETPPSVFSRSNSSSLCQRGKHSISEYSDLCAEEFTSEISELFFPSGPVALAKEEEMDDEFREEGCIHGERNNDQSSSCSGSSLDSETSIRQFTVPVTIEHPPPGLRSSLQEDDPVPEESCKNTCGEDREDQEILEVVVEEDRSQPEEVPPRRQGGQEEVMAPTDEDEGDFHMVLVRDIGIQVSGDSPNLSSTRSSTSPLVNIKSQTQKGGNPSSTTPPSSSSSHSSLPSPTVTASSSSSSNQETDTYVEKFPPEILF